MTQAAVVAKERRAPALAVVESGYIVGRRWPLSELPPEKQQAVRDAYDATGWSSDAGVEFLGFYTDFDTAVSEAAKYPGGFYQSLPVNASLPLEHKRYGVHGFPNSEACDWYEQTSPDAICEHAIDRSELERLHSGLTHHVKELQKIAS